MPSRSIESCCALQGQTEEDRPPPPSAHLTSAGVMCLDFFPEYFHSMLLYIPTVFSNEVFPVEKQTVLQQP